LTHLHSGEDSDQRNGASLKQLQMLSALQKNFLALDLTKVQFHVYNSAGIAHLIKSQGLSQHPLTLLEKKIVSQSQSNLPWGLRPGLMIYGYCESLMTETKNLQQEKLQPIMTLKSQIATVRVLKKNQTVSYGGTWTAKQKSYIGVVPIGYADGYHRLNSNRACVTLFGHQVPVVGRVCMDYLMVDLTALMQKTRMSVNHDALYQSDVILFGPKSQHNQISAEEVAQTSDTMSWEVLTSIGERVPRVYTGQLSRKIVKQVTDKP
jgi:alanine racemase